MEEDAQNHELSFKLPHGESLIDFQSSIVDGYAFQENILISPNSRVLSHKNGGVEDISTNSLSANEDEHFVQSLRQSLLVIGGGGAVGLSAIQLSVAAGCRVVSTCGKVSIDRVMAAGAEQAVDYTSEDLRAELKGQFDAVLDTIGVPETEALGIELLKRGGHYMTLQGEAVSLTDKYGLVAGGAAATVALSKKQVQYRQSHGVNYCWTYMRTDSEGLEEIARLSRVGKLKIPVGKTFPLAEAAEAHRVRESKVLRGKVVLQIE